ncbi:hypothetical protein HY991_05765 [Candidatus Micrarchaeota archaeon]|nr:hypothetical protein [Candidatus Micrarchaeota archaeon]
MEIEGNYLTNFLIDALSQAIGKKGVSIGVQEAFSLLTTPTEPTSLAIEEGALAALAKEIAADREARNVIMNCGEKELENRITNSGNPLLKKLVAHWREYAWILFNFVGPEAPLSYFANKAREQITKGERVSEEKNTLKNKEMLLRELQLDSESERLFDYAREIVWLKGERKNAMYRICWRMEPLVREACKRMDINRELFNALFPWEVGEFLRKGLPKKEIELRSKFMVMDGRKGGEEVLVGEAASSFYARLCVRKTTDEKELRGTCASIGPIVRGRVKIINKPSDMHKMSEGDVLVSFQTDPNLVPAMKKAAAIVTEAGGLTCHAAIVSREMRLPCVVGVKHVTSSLKDGEMVEVDAKLGIVRRLKDSDVH